MAKLELALLVGAESKDFLARLTEQIDRLEKLLVKTPKASSPVKASSTDEDEDDDEVEDKGPMKNGYDSDEEGDFDDEESKDSSKDSDSDDGDSSEDSGKDEEDEEEPKAKKAAKSKAASLKDVNDACKAKAKEDGRPAVLKILEKNFKTKSISELKPSQYEKCISLMSI